jgi:hypothetical protein
MNKESSFLICYDLEGSLLKFTPSDNEAPYVYYNVYGDNWYFDSDSNEHLIDKDGNTEEFFTDGSYTYSGVNGTSRAFDKNGNGVIQNADGRTSNVDTDEEGNTWGYDADGNAFY